MKKPANLLIYYGWLNSFNSAQNQWNNEKVAQDMAKYDLIVIGDGVQNPSHGDWANTQIIIPRIFALNSEIKLFGYVTANQDISVFKTLVDQWDNLGVDGIFIDEAGYDFGKKRTEINERLYHVKSKENSWICFVNAWNIDHVIGIEDDASYPNATFNPEGYESLLSEEDWYLLESFSVNTVSYPSKYASKNDWYTRGTKAVQKREDYGINLAAANIINNDNSFGQSLYSFCHRAAQIFDLNAVGSSDIYYGASSAQVKFWERPKPQVIKFKDTVPAVSIDQNNAEIYMRYMDRTKISIDFTSGSETSTVEKW